MSTCKHKWSMVNIQNGYLVVEGCHRCRARTSFFSTEIVPPVDDYQEGDHFWTYLGSSQAVRFDLRCDLCRQEVSLSDMTGLMLSTCTHTGCEVAQSGSAPGTWVYVALCADSTHPTGHCVSEEGTQALTEYFNANLKNPNKKIIVKPCSSCCSIDTCDGIVIADSGLTEIY